MTNSQLLASLYPQFQTPKRPSPKDMLILWLFGLMILLLIIAGIISQARAEEVYLKASWYSVQSLKDEGTWKTSHGKMANGKKFKDNELTCATRLYPLGTILWVENIKSHTGVQVKVTDRISKKFANTRIDLSRLAFSRIAELKEGVIAVKVKVLK